MPYPGMSNKETTDAVLEGYRMPKPKGKPDEVLISNIDSCIQYHLLV
jgi:hypothetical protein